MWVITRHRRHDFPYVERLILPLDAHVGQFSRLDLVPDLSVDVLGDGDASVMTNDRGPLDLLAEYVLLPQRAVAKEAKITKVAAAKAIDSVTDNVTKELKKGGRISLT